MDRRAFLDLGAGLLASATGAAFAQSAGVASERAAMRLPAGLRLDLLASQAAVSLVGDRAGPTEVWAYNASIPGPVLRLARGQTLEATLRNGLPDPTTIHWHGVRVPNSMDGVPNLTQPPVAPGESFPYRFGCPDSGTYWYHPHLATPEQVERGLSGALVVEDLDPPQVDREIVWVLDDWRLDPTAKILGDFNSFFDVSHGGRFGNTVTINGVYRGSEALRAGERIRLRIVNAANARIFALRFDEHRPWLFALDGQPLAPPRRLDPEHRVLLGPGMRADLILDCAGEAGRAYRVLDVFNPRAIYPVVELRYDDVGSPSRALASRDPPTAAAANPLPEPDLREPMRVAMKMGGGMMGRGWPQDTPQARAERRARRLAGSKEADPVWTINGHAHMAHGPGHPFEFTAERGRTVLIHFENDTNWWHPMHLHGHSWLEIARNGRALADRSWRDTSLLAPGDSLDVAFVADNPGDWILHCHVLEHHAGGMGTQFRVA